MARFLPAVLVLAALGGLAAFFVSGCGSSESPPPPVAAAPPQSAALGWEERSPETGPALIFRVRRFAVTKQGWEAGVAVENRTGIAWEMGEDPVAVEQSFGIMLFATGELDEVERRSRDGDLPGLRPAQEFDPRLPVRLAAGSSWQGVVSARGSLAAGRYVRVVFGPLIAVGDPPDDMPTQFVWITDHAYRLHD
jgi:hypothetical protein